MGKIEVKIILLSVLVFVVLVSTLSFVSSNSAVASMGGPLTLVNGTIYYADTGDPVGGANVVVKCKDNNHVRKHIATEKTTSLEDGTYAVLFSQQFECNEEDLVMVSATMDALTGENYGEVENRVVKSLDVAIVNVSLVPEFGVIVGVLTMLSAIGVFFIIRRK
jgi:hypothetical protein